MATAEENNSKRRSLDDEQSSSPRPPPKKRLLSSASSSPAPSLDGDNDSGQEDNVDVKTTPPFKYSIPFRDPPLLIY